MRLNALLDLFKGIDTACDVWHVDLEILRNTFHLILKLVFYFNSTSDSKQNFVNVLMTHVVRSISYLSFLVRPIIKRVSHPNPQSFFIFIPARGVVKWLQ